MTLRLAACMGALLTLTLPGEARAQVTWREEPSGRTAVVRLRTAPFPHASRPQYRDDRVLVFVPAGHRPGQEVDIVVHYHGHRGETVSSVETRRLREQLAGSGRAAILIAPQGPLRAADSAGGRHEDRDGLRRFLAEALELLAREGVVPEGAAPGTVVLSGHSGGYKVIARALDRGGVDVREVWLHDGLYGELDAFERWVAGDARRRLVSTHTPGGGTRGNNGQLVERLRRRGVPVVTADEDARHRGARAVVVAAPERHDAVTGRFERFLGTSALDEVAAPPPPPPPRGRGLIDALPR
ncbi:MAG: hypothetical protein M9894_12115 [Planctomycetes bacterium]|nr:hypothetical protein [Planctomycetota bacterium]